MSRPKYRIVLQGGQYYPRYRGWFGWRNFMTVGELDASFNTLEAAQNVIERARLPTAATVIQEYGA